MGIYVFDTQVPDSTSCAATPPTRTRAAISARTSSPTSSSTARRSRTASPQSCVRSTAEAEAYWRDVGTVDAYWEANIDLTDIIPELDLYDRDWPIWTYAEITPPAKFVHDEDGRRGMAVISLVSGGCIVSGASLQRIAAVHRRRASIPTPTLDEAVMLPDCRHRPERAAQAAWSSTAACASPKGLVVGEDPELDAKRFRRTEKGICLITQPMIDRLAADADARSSRSPRRSIPLIKTGGLADVAGALPPALAPHGVDDAHAAARLSGGAWRRSARRAGRCTTTPICFGGPARLLAGRASTGSTCSSSTRRISTTGPATPMSTRRRATGPTTGGASRALGRAAADIARGRRRRLSCPTSSMPTTGRRRSTPAYLRLRPAAGRAIGDDHPQPRLPGPVRRRHLRRARPAAAGLRARRRRVLRRRRLPQGRAALRRPRSPRSARPTPRRSRPPAFGMGLDGLLAARAADLARHRQRHRHRGLEPRRPTRMLAATYSAQDAARPRRQPRARSRSASASTPTTARSSCVVSRLTWQKGIDLLADGARRRSSRTAASWRCSAPATRRSRARFRPPRPRHPGRVGVVIGYDEPLSHLMQGGGDAILIPSRFEPCGLTQLYGLRYGCVPVVARAGGLADTVIDANEAALDAGVATGFQFAPVDADALVAGASAAPSRSMRDRQAWTAMQRQGMKSDVSWDTQRRALCRPLRHAPAGLKTDDDHRPSRPRPIADQKPGTSGLRKKVPVFQQPNYVENFVQSIFDSLEGFAGKTLVIGGDGRYYNREVIQIAHRRWPPPTASAGCWSARAASCRRRPPRNVIRKYKAFGGIILSASHNPGGPHERFRHQVQYRQWRPGAGEDHRGDLRAHQGDRRVPDRSTRPTSTSTRSAPQTLGGMTVEVIDPVADYAELMETPVRLRRDPRACSPAASACASTPCTPSPAPTPRRSSRAASARPTGTVRNGTPLPDFGGHHPDPNLVHAKELYDEMMAPDAPDFGAASDGDGDRNLIIGRGIFVTPVGLAGHARRQRPSGARLRATASRASPARCRPAAPPTAWPRSSASACYETPDRLEVLRQPARRRHGHDLRRGERRHRLQPCPREGRALGGAALAQHPRRAQARAPTTIVEEHWAELRPQLLLAPRLRGGRHRPPPTRLMDASARPARHACPARSVGGLTVAAADDFAYHDPVDGSVSQQPGHPHPVRGRLARRLPPLRHRHLRRDAARLHRALRARPGRLDLDTADALADLIAAAEELAAIRARTGRAEPDVIT